MTKTEFVSSHRTTATCQQTTHHCGVLHQQQLENVESKGVGRGFFYVIQRLFLHQEGAGDMLGQKEELQRGVEGEVVETEWVSSPN
mmetsp:Transcript_10628/g.12190  ORF Transcript_10628/g.12190 Transcript_10628/m.12190 type:complete len:86 (-) Transcript_10628:256-513(-)